MSLDHPQATPEDHTHLRDGQLLATIDGIFWEADPGTLQFTYVSEQAEHLLDYPAAQWLTPDFWVAHMHPNDRDWVQRFCTQAISEQRNHSFEYRMLAADGHIVWLRDVVSVVMEGGRATKLRGIMVDVSDRKQVEVALTKSERQLLTLAEHFPDFIVRFDSECRFLYINSAVEQAFGQPREQVIGKTLHELPTKPIAQKDHLNAAIRRAFAENRPNTFEAVFVTNQGERHFEIRHIPEVDEHGQVVSVLGVTREITAQKQAEAARKSYLWFLESMDKINRAIQGTNDLEQLLRDVLDTVLAIFDCDRAGLLSTRDPSTVAWSAAKEQIWVIDPQLLDAGVPLLTYPEMMELLQRLTTVDRPVTFGQAADYPLLATTAHFSLQAAMTMAIYPKGDVPYLFELHHCYDPHIWTAQEQQLFQEIGRRLGDALTTLLAYRRLEESELRYREVFENTSDVIVITEVTPAGRLRLLDINPAWEAIIGIDRAAILGRFLDEFGLDEIVHNTLARYQACLQNKARLHYEEQWHTRTGEWQMDNTLIPICDATGKVYRVIGVGRNITEQKRAEAELRASEARFRIFVDHATDAFFLHAEGGEILDLNRQAAEYLGYTREELIGMMPTAFDANLTDRDLAQLQARIEPGKVLIFEARHRHKNGTILPVEVSVQSFQVGGQRFSVSLTRDITERKRVQEELTLFRSLLDHTGDIIEVIDPQTGHFLDVNEQACVIHGYTRAEYLTLTAADVNPQVALEPWSNIVDRLREAGSYIYESQHQRKDGSTFAVEISATYIQLDRDYLLAVVRDISARKRAEAALKASEERYRILYDDNPSMYFTLDQAGLILSVNHFGAEHLGYTIAELTDRPVLHLFYPDDQAAALQALQQCVEQPGQVFHWSLRKVHKNGTVLWVEEAARAISRIDGSLMVLVVCEDISARKRTEQALVESHNLLNAIVEGTDDCVFVKDLQGRYLMMNRAGAKLMGKRVEEVIGNDDFALFDAETAHRFQERDRQIMTMAETHMIEEVEANVAQPRTYLTAKNAYRNADGTVVGLIGISREITELKRLEEQLRQAQKMEALGRLAGGVAHDFNNLLTVINGYSHLLFNRLKADSINRTPVVEIQKAGERAAGLTRQLLAFSRKQVLQPQVVDINILLTELIQLLRRLIGENIELTLISAPTLGLAKLDPGQFEQAIVNLAVNARDAMPQGGQLTLETANITVSAEYTELHPELTPGPYVCVTMRDSGLGMDEATMARIFEPFFTTKGPGQGTGLGLAMVYGFVKQSDGQIEVFSKLNEGTTFKLYLPVAATQQLSTKPEPSDPSWLDGTETVLLVEDEASVRELVSDILVAHGYRVLEASEPEKGIALAANYAGPIHLLLTDVIMPQMDGRKLARHLVAVRADLKVLYMSGYTENVIVNHELISDEIAFIQKPFSVDGLLQKVRAVLG